MDSTIQNQKTDENAVPEHLKSQSTASDNQLKKTVIFDEKTKEEAKKMSFLQKLKATLFPVKVPKKDNDATNNKKEGNDNKKTNKNSDLI